MLNVLTDTTQPVGRQVGFFYFLLFLFSRYARNVIRKLPKAISKLMIPINIKIISVAVILTHLPSPHRQAGYVAREATTCRRYSICCLGNTCYILTFFFLPCNNEISKLYGKRTQIKKIHNLIFSLHFLYQVF